MAVELGMACDLKTKGCPTSIGHHDPKGQASSLVTSPLKSSNYARFFSVLKGASELCYMPMLCVWEREFYSRPPPPPKSKASKGFLFTSECIVYKPIVIISI